MSTERHRLSQAWFCLLLRLYPDDFREELGEALLETYRDRARDACALGGRRALARLWLRALVDSLRNGLGERRARRPSPGAAAATGGATRSWSCAACAARRLSRRRSSRHSPSGWAPSPRSTRWPTRSSSSRCPTRGRTTSTTSGATTPGSRSTEAGWPGRTSASSRLLAARSQAVAGMRHTSMTLSQTNAGEPQEIGALVVTPNLFTVLGVRPLLGALVHGLGNWPRATAPGRPRPRPLADEVRGRPLRRRVRGPARQPAVPRDRGDAARLPFREPREHGPPSGRGRLSHFRHQPRGSSVGRARLLGSTARAGRRPAGGGGRRGRQGRRGARRAFRQARPEDVSRLASSPTSSAGCVPRSSSCCWPEWACWRCWPSISPRCCSRGPSSASASSPSPARSAPTGWLSRERCCSRVALSDWRAASLEPLLAFWATRALVALSPLDFPRRDAIAVDWGVASTVVAIGLVARPARRRRPRSLGRRDQSRHAAREHRCPRKPRPAAARAGDGAGRALLRPAVRRRPPRAQLLGAAARAAGLRRSARADDAGAGALASATPTTPRSWASTSACSRHWRRSPA